CSGGLFDSTQGSTEVAIAMKHWLRYVQPDLTVEVEKESLTTIDNILKIQPLIQGEKIVVVSSGYHSLRTKLAWKLIGRTKIDFVPAAGGVTMQKLIIEAIGCLVVLCWCLGFEWPERYFRKKARNCSRVK
ncbi:DUF218 domain-containing protein, partial [Candidatus Falkowbacteria bacterium]|nr:DUF218 domain-containing protein [Candidatus Falkowbacteria bacterium]